MDSSAILALFIEAVKQQQIKISLHAAEEALADEITRSDIDAALSNTQLLEDYPDWWLGPSCLIYVRPAGGVIFTLLHLILAYRLLLSQSMSLIRRSGARRLFEEVTNEMYYARMPWRDGSKG